MESQLLKEGTKYLLGSWFFDWLWKCKSNLLMDTSNIMQLKSCTYAFPAPSSDSLCPGHCPKFLRIHLSSKPSPTAGNSDLRAVNPSGVLWPWMPFNSCMRFQRVDEFSNANVHLFNTWFGWRHSSSNAITTITLYAEREIYIYLLLPLDQSKRSFYLGSAL